MTWETVVGGALTGISNFVNSFVDIIGSALNPAAVEGIIALLCIGIIIRLVDTAPKIPGKIIDKVSQRRKRRDEHDDDDDDDGWEYIRVRRRK